MQSETREHNILDDDVVRRTASELTRLFTPDAPLPALTAKSLSIEKSPPLIDDIQNVPPVPIVPLSTDVPVMAIDGGSSVLAKGGNIEVICWRAGYVSFLGINRQNEWCEPLQVLAYNRIGIDNLMSDFLAGTGFIRLTDEPIISPVNELRWVSEWTLLRNLIDDAPQGTVILVDGTLRVNPHVIARPQHDLFRRAVDKGVHIAAVTKTSALSLDNTTPIDIMALDSRDGNKVWYRQLNKTLPPDSPWLGDVYLAGLHPGADKRYRVDINRYGTHSVDEIFAALASVADDTEFAGYPYPLVAAHRLARIDMLFKQSMLDSIDEALRLGDFPDGLWHFLTGDIHDKLNADVMELTANEE